MGWRGMVAGPCGACIERGRVNGSPRESLRADLPSLLCFLLPLTAFAPSLGGPSWSLAPGFIPRCFSTAHPVGASMLNLRRARAWWSGPLALAWLGLMFSAVRAEDGASIYKRTCARCHGASGEGNADEYDKPLVGDRSVEQLAKLIGKTMPADDPGALSESASRSVASYIHEAFYSPLAQARNQPARIALSRLTVRQYRNVLTDLIGTFRAPAPAWGEERGLRGAYYASRRMRGAGQMIDRIDPQINFDFGITSPDPGRMDGSQFSIRWEGSVLAPDTGDHEFIVRTEHAMRFWINDLGRPLIDATVKSGSDTEYRATIHLEGGRAYPLRLEFSKAKQGVDDSKKQMGPPRPVAASIALCWQPPGRAEEVVPSRLLTPARYPEGFVLQTPFPPDDLSVGYVRGTSISKEWDQATTDAAIEAAGYVAARLPELSGARERDSDREAKLRTFCERLAERAFRRPLSEGQKRLYIDSQFEAGRDLALAVKRVVLLVLKSPRFLYPELGERGVDGFDVASRLALGLWDSLPDEALLKAARAGELTTAAEVRKQAERMVDDPRARSKLRSFLLQWLRVEPIPDLSKAPEEYREFTEAVASDLRTSLELFLEDALWGEGSDFRQLFLTDSLYLNGRLAKLYGADLPEEAPFQKVTVSPGRRAGVLTHPYLMSTFAYTSTTSPIHRGVFISRSVLGRALRPPPEAVSPLAPDLHPSLTTRERVETQTGAASCQTCHAMINPLGFPLENFDAIGRYRSEEKGKPIDATGSYLARDGETVPFDGPRALAAFLADSDEAHDAFVEQLFHALVKQPIRAYGAAKTSALRRSFIAHEYSVRALMVEMMVGAALTVPDSEP